MKWAYSEPATAEKKAPDDERQQPRVHDPDADRLGRHAVLALGEHVAAVARALDPPHGVDDDEAQPHVHHRSV